LYFLIQQNVHRNNLLISQLGNRVLPTNYAFPPTRLDFSKRSNNFTSYLSIAALPATFVLSPQKKNDKRSQCLTPACRSLLPTKPSADPRGPHAQHPPAAPAAGAEPEGTLWAAIFRFTNLPPTLRSSQGPDGDYEHRGTTGSHHALVQAGGISLKKVLTLIFTRNYSQTSYHHIIIFKVEGVFLPFSFHLNERPKTRCSSNHGTTSITLQVPLCIFQPSTFQEFLPHLL